MYFYPSHCVHSSSASWISNWPDFGLWFQHFFLLLPLQFSFFPSLDILSTLGLHVCSSRGLKAALAGLGASCVTTGGFIGFAEPQGDHECCPLNLKLRIFAAVEAGVAAEGLKGPWG